jgi:hypothetical protein
MTDWISNPNAKALVQPISDSDPYGVAPTGGAETPAIAWLRRYCWGQAWAGIGPDDDYNIFGSLKLSHLRDALSAFDDALLAARQERDALRDAVAPLVEKYGYGTKVGRADEACDDSDDFDSANPDEADPTMPGWIP